LHGAKFHGANLRNANLFATDLGSARFDGASLVEAQLQGAIIGGETYFVASDLYKAKLECSEIIGSIFTDANLVAARMWRAMLLNNTFEIVDLRAINFEKVDDEDTAKWVENPYIRARCARKETTVSGTTYKSQRCEDKASLLCRQSSNRAAYFNELQNSLTALGCKDEWLGKGIAMRLEFEENSSEILRKRATLGPISVELSRRLLDPRCAAAQLISGDLKVQLQRIAGSR
jgi:hypothetical protein